METNTQLTKNELIETARTVVQGKLGNSGSYAWLTGSMSIFITEQQAQQILKVAVQNYGEGK